MRATSETVAPGSSDAATSRSFSSCDHRRRRSTEVITSAREIVIALLLGLPLGPAALASVNQGGPHRRNTVRDLLEGLYVCPTRIVAFNIGEGWCRDATIDIARELGDICVNMDQVPECVADLIAEYASGEDWQPEAKQGDTKLT